MPIYLVQRAAPDETPYDGYYGFVCVAESVREARFMHPDGFVWMPNGFKESWSNTHDKTPRWSNGDNAVTDRWPDPRQNKGYVKVICLSNFVLGSNKPRIILASNKGS